MKYCMLHCTLSLCRVESVASMNIRWVARFAERVALDAKHENWNPSFRTKKPRIPILSKTSQAQSRTQRFVQAMLAHGISRSHRTWGACLALVRRQELESFQTGLRRERPSWALGLRGIRLLRRLKELLFLSSGSSINESRVTWRPIMEASRSA